MLSKELLNIYAQLSKDMFDFQICFFPCCQRYGNSFEALSIDICSETMEIWITKCNGRDTLWRGVLEGISGIFLQVLHLAYLNCNVLLASRTATVIGMNFNNRKRILWRYDWVMDHRLGSKGHTQEECSAETSWIFTHSSTKTFQFFKLPFSHASSVAAINSSYTTLKLKKKWWS